MFVLTSPCFAVNSDEIIVLGDSIMIWKGGESLYKTLEAKFMDRGYKEFKPFPGDDTHWCGNNTKNGQYYLGGAAIANFLGYGSNNCKHLKDAIENSTAKWVVVMLGWNDCLRMGYERTTINGNFITLMETIASQGRIPIVISEYYICRDKEPPMNGKPSGGNCRKDNNDNMYWIRGEMEAYCNIENIPFLDLSDYILSKFSEAYSKQPIDWPLVHQQMKQNWADNYLRNGDEGDGVHPEENAIKYVSNIIVPWMDTVLDLDSDGVSDDDDNCPSTPNGPEAGTCIAGDEIGDHCTSAGTNTSECGTGGFCSMEQKDSDGDLMGDACDNTFFVDWCSGDDNHEGRTWLYPKKTIQGSERGHAK
jgi:lysophospholipase L1-like esterase